MAYVNIHEYDYTITAPDTYSENIVAIPINATDGPSDKWIAVANYNEFIQIFGPNPNPASLFGNSWEYAANLLLRGMTVLVRRITNVLDGNGNNAELLPGVKTARTPIKIKNIFGTEKDRTFVDKDMEVIDPYKTSVLTPSILGTAQENKYYFKNNDIVEGEPKEIFDNIYALEQATIQAKQNGKKFTYNQSFAEVYNADDKKTYQWLYIGDSGKSNPYYKGSCTWNELIHKKQTGVNGDFWISSDAESDNGHIFYYDESQNNVNEEYLQFIPQTTYEQELSEDVIASTTFDINPYPYSYLLPKIQDEYFTGKFTRVMKHIYKENNELKLNENPSVWVYNENVNEIVYNPNFVQGTETVDALDNIDSTIADIELINDYKTWCKGFNSKNDINIDNPSIGSYAIIKEDNEWKLFVYSNINDDVDWHSMENSLSLIFTNEMYRICDYVHFEQVHDVNNKTVDVNKEFLKEVQTTSEGKKINIYYVYNSIIKFVNFGESEGISPKNSLIPFTERIYWYKLIPTETNPVKQKIKIIGSETIVNTISIETSLGYLSSGISLVVRRKDFASDIKINKDFEVTRLNSGKFKLTNNSNTDTIRIYDFNIQKVYNNTANVLYDANLKGIKANDTTAALKVNSLLYFEDSIGAKILYPQVKFDETSTAYIELQPKESIVFNQILENAKFIFEVATFNTSYLDFYLHNSSDGYYKLTLSDVDNTPATLTKCYLQKDLSDIQIAEYEDYDDLELQDGFGNFNIFKAEYYYPGTNGNAINVRIKNAANQGLYAYVYRNKQFLERLELCSYKTELNGRIKRLDIESYKLDIWLKLLLKFGVMIEEDGTPVDLNRNPINKDSNYDATIYGKYVKISLNPKILTSSEITDIKYIEALYAQNGSHINNLSAHQGTNPNDDDVQHEIPNCYYPLADKYKYDIKFISNGGYFDKIIYSSEINSMESSSANVRPIEDAMLTIAITRGDCVAYLDVPFELPVEDVPYYFDHISSSYAAAYDPWGQMILETGTTKWMPPSFIQLYTHARSIQNGNKLYLPPAGVKRAMIPELLQVNHELPTSYMTEWQSKDAPQYINPIIWINGYDYTIFGQKTLYHIVNQSNKYESALQDLNVRLVANEIKKKILKVCISLTFELNNIMTWNEFKSKMEPLLSVMAAEGVLTNYSVIMGKETMTQADLNSGHIVGTVRASIARAATDWDINFEITPNTLTFTEYDYNSQYNE